ncbi:hypothetical protein MtrunA17_Chr6g0484251 [Medicago truncatula]|uniref:Uncharacterized protein n=1 Tax=Medicago truncatula TaxID=3880 RepID=I3SUW3_MEDTR|nr:unknown [Medicago truncatula]RHN52784.1 hypothetical protein MtrunA17_Chr6g0484251 [Medicago truncatula]
MHIIYVKLVLIVQEPIYCSFLVCGSALTVDVDMYIFSNDDTSCTSTRPKRVHKHHGGKNEFLYW